MRTITMLETGTPHFTLSQPYKSRLRRGVLAVLLAALNLLLWVGLTGVLQAAGGILHVAPAGVDATTCGTVLAPCRTIQYAVGRATAGDEIRVATGVYTSTETQVVFINKALTLRGGFTTADWLTPNPVANPTVIDGEYARRGVLIDGNATVTLSGFHVRQGRLTEVNEPGAGIYNRYGILTVEDCEIYYNSTEGGPSDRFNAGGGVASGNVQESNRLILRRNRIYENSATFSGGGVAILKGDATLERNRIYNNTARFGAGFVLDDGAATLDNNVLYGNATAANGSGGAIAVDSDGVETLTLRHNTIYGNSATVNAGGILITGGAVTITNTLSVNNTAPASPTTNRGAIVVSGGMLTMTHSDFHNNTPNHTQAELDGWGGNNRFQNPQFVNAAGGDFRLNVGSPAINTGAYLPAVSDDLLGYGRPTGGGWDRGAHEYSASALCYARVQGGTVYNSVQAAVAVAAAGDLVQVAGRCAGAVTIGQDLTLRGGYTATDWANARYGPTVLDGQGTQRVLRLSNGVITVENLHITGGVADYGAGIYVESAAAQLTLNNAVLYGNAATNSGGGLYNSGAATVNFSTFYSNTAGLGGAIFAHQALTVRNTAIIANSGSGIRRTAGVAVTADYNAYHANTPDAYGNVTPGAHDLHAAPQFVNAAGGDFHLLFSSPLVNAADPAATLTYDFESDPRPRGERADIGADERLFFAAVSITPPTAQVLREDLGDLQGQTFTFTHTLKNTGYTANFTDIYDVVVTNEDGWVVAPTQILGIELQMNETQQIQVAVTVPATVTLGFYNRTFIVATSRASAGAIGTAVDAIVNPGLIFEPDYLVSADPGQLLTYTHTLTNVGPADVFDLELNSSQGWGEILSPQETSVALGPNEAVEVVVRVQVPEWAAAGVQDVTVVRATSQAFGIFDEVTDRTIAKATVGDRFVRVGGIDTNNNCTQPDRACATVGHTVQQAAGGDSVIIAEGSYNDNELLIDRPISLLAGYRYSAGAFTEIEDGPDPTKTVLNFNNTGRGVRIEPAGGTGAGPLLRGFTIRNANAGSGDGGGVLLVGSASARLNNMRLENVSAARGGALYVANGTARLEQVWVENAQAQLGGALYNANGSMVANRLSVRDSRALTGAGGAAYNAGPASLRLDNSMIYSNTAATSGGALYNAGALTAWNNTLAYNQAPNFGGGLYDHNSAALLVRNTIFYSNTAGSAGGGLYRSNPAAPNHSYNTFWLNQAPLHPQRNFSAASSDVLADPLFVDAAAGNFNLTFESPCVDTGDPTTPLTQDFEGDARPSNHGYDIGADELRGCLARVLDPNTLEPIGPLFNGVQQAVDFAPEHAFIQVHGVCFGVQPRLLDSVTVSQTVYISKSLTLRGGYPATFEEEVFEETFLDALGQGRVAIVTNPSTMTLQVTLSRITLVNGQAGAGESGGGVYNDVNVALRLAEVTIANSQAGHGGGVYNRNGAWLTLGETAFAGNLSLGHGGALYNLGQMTTFSPTLFLMNAAQNLGGAIYNTGGGQMTLNAATVLSNTAAHGGGIYNTLSGQLMLQNSLVVSNTASGNGGGLHNLRQDVQVRHATFYGNTAERGAGIYHNASVAGALINSTLLVGNHATVEYGALYNAGIAPTFDYNGMYGNTPNNINIPPGVGTILQDPLFLSFDPTSPQFLRIPSGSPAEDAADPASPVLTDIDDKPRPSNQGFDIGASETGDCYIRINGELPTYGNMQRAIRYSSNGDVLYIAGICRGVNPVSYLGTTYYQTAFITKSLGFQGGYTVTNWTEPNPVSNTTRLDAAGFGRVAYITASPVVTMSGLHLAQGVADNGAGIFMASGVFTLTESHVYSHTASGDGGGFYQQDGAAVLTGQNHFHHNQATQGGALYQAGGELTLDGNFAHDNTATRGGALYRAGGQTVAQNTFIYRNAAQEGAGFYNAVSGVFWIRHNTFYANAVSTHGGGLYTVNRDPVVRSNIFASNTGPGHAIYNNSALSYTTPDYNGIHPLSGALVNTQQGAHDVLLEPGFVDATVDDFRLADTSAMLDKGDPAMQLGYDFEADLRPADQGFDIGADERRSCWAQILRGAVNPETFGPYASPQLAINASEPDDIIQVTVGECRGVHPFVDGATTYYQTVHITHNLSLQGGFLRDFSGQVGEPLSYPDPEQSTIFHATSAGRALLIARTTAVTVEQVNLAFGAATPGGGVNRGGALLVGGAQTRLVKVGIYDSQAANGGAVSLSLNPTTQRLTLDGVRVYSNTATLGGGLYVPGAVVTVTGASEFGYNTATQHGGALYNHDGALYVTGENVELHHNEATQYGGALYSRNSATAQVSIAGAHFASNRAQRGGGLYGELHSKTLVDLGTRFYLNEATQGGAIYGGGNNFNVQNTLVYVNIATQGGGVFIATSPGAPLVQHNTIVSNTATNQGGAVYVEGSTGMPYLRNNIFQENQANEGSAVYATIGTLGYNNYYPLPAEMQVAGGVAFGDGNLVDYPWYVAELNLSDPEQLPTVDFHLEQFSTLIDAGLDVNVTRDMDNHPRPINLGPDIGADEYPECLARVASTGIVYGEIQAALDNAADGDTVDVAEGICYERVQVSRDITIVGSWKKDFSGTTEIYPSSYVNAQEAGRTLTVMPDVQADISMMAFVNGRITGDGGNVYVNSGADVEFVYCSINYGYASQDGGGIYNSASSTVELSDTSTFSNQAARHGGGVYNAAGSNVTISGGGTSYNEALNGAGLYNASADFSFVNHGVVRNIAATHGGGFYNTVANINPINIRYVRNEAGSYGGGIYNAGSGMTLWHNTIYLNAAQQGGGVYNTAGSWIANASIVAENTATTGAGIYSAQAASTWRTLKWNNDYSGVTTELEMVADPMLTTAGRLTYHSPAIDAVPSAESPITFDGLTNPRPQLCDKDMGSHEYSVGVREFEWVDAAGVTLPPGTAYTYTVQVTNLSEEWRVLADSKSTLGPGTGYTETLRVSWDTSRGWAEIVEVTNVANLVINPAEHYVTFDLGPGTTAEILVRVTIPPNQYASVEGDPRTYEITQLTYTTLGCRVSLEGPVATIETRVAEDLSCLLTPTGLSSAVRPGESVSYTHIITNTGNLTTTYTLVTAPGFYGAAVVLSPTTPITQSVPMVWLGPGMSATVTISVTVRPEIAAGLTDIATLIGSVNNVAQCTVADYTTVLTTTGIRYVALNGTDSNVDETLGGNPVDLPDNNCTQPQIAPCKTLQHALGQSLPGEEVRIAAGAYSDVYTVTQGSETLAQMLYISHPLTITGGYLASDWDTLPPDHIAHPTELNANGDGRAVYIATTGPVRLERLTLLDGVATGQGGGPGGEDAGGNVYNIGADLHLNALRINGGGAALGGGLYSAGGNLLLTNNLFHDNGGSEAGGALYLRGGSAHLFNNTLYRNHANQDGGAVYLWQGGLTLTNNIIAGHTSEPEAGGGSLAAVHVEAGSYTAGYNLWHNNTSNHVSGLATLGVEPVQADPRFVDPDAAPPDLYLLQASPAREKADPATPLVMFPLGLDYANLARLMGLRVDIGAYEYLVEPSFELIPAYRYTTPNPGAALVFTHTLRNTGEFTDTYTLSWSSNRNWITALDVPGPVMLGPSAEQLLTLTGVVPGSGSAGLTDMTLITATSQLSAGAFRVARNETRARFTPAVLVTPEARAGNTNPTVAITYFYTVTNIGDGWDSYTLTVSAPPAGWTAELLAPQVTPELAPFGGAHVLQVTVTPPATALSGETAVVTITATSTFDGVTADTSTATTTVNQVRDVRLVSDQTQNITTEPTIIYNHTLTNLGNATETLTLAYVSSQGWSGAFLQPATLPVTLGPNESTTVQFELTVPPGSGGLTDVSVITATIQGTALYDTVVDTTNVTPYYEFALLPTPLTRAAAPGETIVFTHTLTNLGNVADTYNMGLTSGQPTWASFTPSGPLTLQPGGAAVITVTVVVPTDAVAQTVISTLRATSQGNSATRDAVDTVVVSLGDQPILGLQAHNDSPTALGNSTALWATYNTGNDITFTWNFGDGSPTAPGQNVNHTYPAVGNYTAVVTASNAISTVTASTLVTITEQACIPPQITGLTSNSPVQIGISMQFSATATGTPELVYSWGFGGAGTATGETTSTPTFTYANPGEYTVTLTVSNACGQAVETLPVTVLPEVIVRDVLLAPDNSRYAAPGSQVVYRHTITNTGNTADTFDLTWQSSQGWSASLLPAEITLGAGLSAPVTFTLTVPPAATGSDMSIITATSRGDVTVFDTATNTTFVLTENGAELTPDYLDGRVDPGASITYRHTLTNTSAQDFTFIIAYQQTPVWTVVADPTSVLVPAGQARPVTVTVTAPTGALSGTVHNLTVLALAVEDPDVTAFATDRTTVNQIFGVNLLPDTQNAQGFPGDTVVYQHTLTNLGNGLDTFTVQRTAAPLNWPVVVMPEIVALAPGASHPVTVTVTIPTGATAGETDTVSVWATSQGNPTAMFYAFDTTTVRTVDVRLVYLPLVLRNYNPNLPDLVVTGISILPVAPVAGQSVTVRITVRNQGAQPVAFGNNFYVDFYVNRMPQPLTPGDIVWGAQGSWFGVGQSRTFETYYVFPSAGAQQVYAQVDTDNTVAETHEWNNVFGPQTITVSSGLIQGAQPVEPLPVAPPPAIPGPRPTPTLAP